MIEPEAVISRMKQALKVSKDIELARALEIRHTTVSSWRRQETVPCMAAIRVAEMTGVSADFLFGIDGPQHQPLDYEIEASVYNAGFFIATKYDRAEFEPKEFADFLVDLFRYSVTRKKSKGTDADLSNIVEFHHLQKARKG